MNSNWRTVISLSTETRYEETDHQASRLFDMGQCCRSLHQCRRVQADLVAQPVGVILFGIL